MFSRAGKALTVLRIFSHTSTSTARRIGRYEPHVRDWADGDPTWQGGKGKGLIGGLNYLASQGVNSAPTSPGEGRLWLKPCPAAALFDDNLSVSCTRV